jgi:hypothetical protein
MTDAKLNTNANVNQCKFHKNDYTYLLDNTVLEKIKMTKSHKIDSLNNAIPKFKDYNLFLKSHYNIKQLKHIAKEYKLKTTGNKSQLMSCIYSHLYLSQLIIPIQKIIRGYIRRKYNHIRGPGFKNRSLCTNTVDFFSMDELTTITDDQFFSFKDKDGFIYGFDILSLYNLIYKCNGVVKNPFNQQPLGSIIIDNFKTLIRLSKILKINIIVEIADVNIDIPDKKQVELRALTLFQHIDALGNYSNSQWFLSLNRLQLIKFIRELIDIWTYRANLTFQTQQAICNPSGNPFQRMPNFNILYNIPNLDEVRNNILEVMEKMVTTGIDKDSKCLGAYYVLGALTLVSNDAATSLPWLFEASYHM